MDKQKALKVLRNLQDHFKQQRAALKEMEQILEPKKPDNMNNINIRRIVNNVGNQVMVTYEENKVNFEMVGLLQRPKEGKYFGISNTSPINQSSTVVFHPDNVSEVLETPLEKYRVKINIDPSKSNYKPVDHEKN